MLRLIGFVVVAMVVIGFFGPELEQLAKSTPDDPAPSVSPPAQTPPVAHPSGRVEIAANGDHFFLSARINGRPINTMVDTGATLVALRASDAKTAGLIVLPGDYRESVVTANGRTTAARVRLQDMEIDGIRLANVDALVLGDEVLSVNLLGMSFLGRLQSFSIRDGRLTLVQ